MLKNIEVRIGKRKVIFSVNPVTLYESIFTLSESNDSCRQKKKRCSPCPLVFKGWVGGDGKARVTTEGGKKIGWV